MISPRLETTEYFENPGVEFVDPGAETDPERYLDGILSSYLKPVAPSYFAKMSAAIHIPRVSPPNLDRAAIESGELQAVQIPGRSPGSFQSSSLSPDPAANPG